MAARFPDQPLLSHSRVIKLYDAGQGHWHGVERLILMVEVDAGMLHLFSWPEIVQ